MIAALILLALAHVPTAATSATAAPQSAPAPGPPQAAQPEAPIRVAPGSAFPAMTVEALMPESAPPRHAVPVDLGTLLGKKPIVICYLLAGSAPSEQVCTAVQNLIQKDLKGTAAMYFAVKLGPDTTAESADSWMTRLGVKAPVILESQHLLGARMGAYTSPSICLIDAQGSLRIADAKSLKQMVATGMTFEQAVREAAARRPVPAVPRLAQYYPVTELVGEKAPDFELAQFKAPGRFKLSRDAAGGNKLTVLFFWHPNCKHCKLLMPSLIAGIRSAPEHVRLVSVVNLNGADEEINCEDAIKAHGMPQPVLVDENKKVNDAYHVVSTPTLLFLRPDGVVDSVYTSSRMNFMPVMNAKLQSILGLKPPAAPGTH